MRLALYFVLLLSSCNHVGGLIVENRVTCSPINATRCNGQIVELCVSTSGGLAWWPVTDCSKIKADTSFTCGIHADKAGCYIN